MPAALALPSAKSDEAVRSSPRADIYASIADAGGYSVMVGIGETYIVPFALAVGAGKTAGGLAATLPMLAGATLQLLSPMLVRRLGSHRLWVAGCVFLQAIALLLLPMAIWLAPESRNSNVSGFPASVCWIYLAATLYWFSGLSGGPAWNTWIETIIPKRVRTKFFSCRTRTGQAFTLLGFASGGLALHWAKGNDLLLPAFCAILLTAAAARIISGIALLWQSEPQRGRINDRPVPIRQLFASTAKNGGTLVWYLLAMQVAVQISGPYFNPYLIRDQGISYFDYMLMIGLAFVGKVLATPFWGRVAQRAGAKRLLWIGGIAIIPVASFWVISDWFSAWQWTMPFTLPGSTENWVVSGEFLYICVVQLISGITWAAYELAMLLMFFEAIPRQDRTSMLTFYNWGNAAAMVIGSFIGAGVLALMHESHTAFLTVFGLSSVFRLMTVGILFWAPDLRLQKVPPVTTPLGIGPTPAQLNQPVMVTIADVPEEKVLTADRALRLGVRTGTREKSKVTS
ncbi:MFS transporter [Anatilimnocola floriformis]|uniref:MFS transporter n=1 Tax=Anatilimnocola floriformis TaxID=2948575 RepID=UPI0020C4FECB|nr:MFS transporter [Anatilimnocola floriformis]